MSGSATPGLVLGGEPRAQLLPPSVKAREKSRSTRRLMAMLVVLAIVLAGAGVGWAYLQKTNADRDLEAANQLTTEILAQQAQYAEAAQIAKLVMQSSEAERTVTATEVLWLGLYQAVLAYVPSDTPITGYALVVPAPWEQPLVPEGPIREPRVAKLTFEFSGSNYVSPADFLRNIPALYGFADVKIDSVKLDDGVYVTTVTVTLDVDAISGRFAEEEEDEGAEPESESDDSDAEGDEQ